MNFELFNYQKISKHRDLIAKQVNNDNFIFHVNAQKLQEIIEIYFPQSQSKKFNILETNCWHGVLTNYLANIARNIYCLDFSSEILTRNKKKNSNIYTHLINSEILPKLNLKFDLIVDFLGIFFINNLPIFLQQIKNLLNHQGIFIAIFPGPKTLLELKKSFIEIDLQVFKGMYQRIIPLFDPADIITLLTNLKFKNINISTENVDVEYSNFAQIIKDLRIIGNPMPQNSSINKKYYQKLVKIYKESYSNKVSIELLKVIAHA